MKFRAYKCSQKPQSLNDLFSYKGCNQIKPTKELMEYNPKYLHEHEAMFETSKTGQSLDLVRKSMDECQTQSGGPYEPRPSTFLNRILPLFDKAVLVVHQDDKYIKEKCYQSPNGNRYKIPFAKDFDDDEVLYACLVQEKGQVKSNAKSNFSLVCYSAAHGRYPKENMKDLLLKDRHTANGNNESNNVEDDSHYSLEEWMPIDAIRSGTQLVNVLKLVFIYHGLVAEDDIKLSKTFGVELTRVCRALPAKKEIHIQDTLAESATHISSAETVPGLIQAQRRTLGLTFRHPASALVGQRRNSRDLTRNRQGLNHSQLLSNIPPRDTSSAVPPERLDLPTHSSARSSPFSARERCPSVSRAPPAQNVLAEIEAAEIRERNGREMLQPMQRHLQTLKNEIEANEQSLALQKIEMKDYETKVEEVEEQIANEVEIIRKGISTIDARTAKLRKRFAKFVPDDEPHQQRPRH
ncbi:hypothetical protein SLS60_003020 [Paraconiothyrium brasiliense]|uniref:Uncharacterized protein n=1 Tax=Paraconiothyrium brasiliense TaxID=300254 RepID=A0ABR3RUG5_9PLEO